MVQFVVGQDGVGSNERSRNFDAERPAQLRIERVRERRPDADADALRNSWALDVEAAFTAESADGRRLRGQLLGNLLGRVARETGRRLHVRRVANERPGAARGREKNQCCQKERHRVKGEG